jgi:hypothetical protein
MALDGEALGVARKSFWRNMDGRNGMVHVNHQALPALNMNRKHHIGSVQQDAITQWDWCCWIWLLAATPEISREHAVKNCSVFAYT